MKSTLTFVTLIFAVFFLCGGCSQTNAIQRDVSAISTEDLIKLLEDPNDPYNLFWDITSELAERKAPESAPALSIALTYPRRDSSLAGMALIEIGSNAKLATPILVMQLTKERVAVQKYSALSLGAIGDYANCAVPDLAVFLWHSNAEVRSSAAIAIDAITGKNLLDSIDKLDPKNPGLIPLDEPEGIMSSAYREWWQSEGQNTEWPTKNCETQK